MSTGICVQMRPGENYVRKGCFRPVSALNMTVGIYREIYWKIKTVNPLLDCRYIKALRRFLKEQEPVWGQRCQGMDSSQLS